MGEIKLIGCLRSARSVVMRRKPLAGGPPPVHVSREMEFSVAVRARGQQNSALFQSHCGGEILRECYKSKLKVLLQVYSVCSSFGTGKKSKA